MNNIKRFKNIARIAVFMLLAVGGFYACEEGDRFAISSDDKTPPAAPVFDSLQVRPGGARLFYQIPADKDVISIEASFTATNGKLIKSAVSFVAPYLDVFGLADTLEHTIQLYALDRAGNQSEKVNVSFKPLKPAYQKVAETLTVQPSFGALYINWKNELQQSITVFVDFTYSDNGTQRTLTRVYSSRDTTEQVFIKQLQGAVDVKVNVEDLYGNQSGFIDKGTLQLLVDEQLDKSKLSIPEPGTVIGGKMMGYGDCWGGKISIALDGNIDYLPPIGVLDDFTFFHTAMSFMVNGVNANAWPQNLFIDLGEKFELSRFVIHQFWDHHDPPNAKPTDREGFYGGTSGTWVNNLRSYNMYYWVGSDDATSGEWVLVRNVNPKKPDAEMGNMDIIRMALQGDEALMYDDNPRFTPATRYFRIEPVRSWAGTTGQWGFSELTLYGRKATR
ncbi:hypothetical protein FACS189464_2460 [Bacteroidia bacterium]|nr:hypothetical protein FACS189464_2460 [Bacteroidia bacterium]